jgi:predicted SnoaL-like aldol condensation-catalyzing enzyme
MTATADQVTANRAVVEQLYELINHRELDKVATLVAAHYIDRSTGNAGAEGMAAAMANLHRADADTKIELVDMIAEGDLVAVRWLETGHHVSQVFDLKPTHEPFKARGTNVYRVQDGHVVESWLGLDPATIRTQRLAPHALESPHLSNRSVQKVVIDRFVVPRRSRAPFVQTSGAVQDVVKGMPGFVEGFVYENSDADGVCLFVSTVVWKDQEAFELAKTLVPRKLQELGLNPAETMQKLDVQLERGVYERTPF